MKTFKDLEFKNEPYFTVEERRLDAAQMDFDNGYGISVITDGFSNDSHPYEVAVLLDGEICYDTHITDDVIGYLDEDGVTLIMKQIQEL